MYVLFIEDYGYQVSSDHELDEERIVHAVVQELVELNMDKSALIYHVYSDLKYLSIIIFKIYISESLVTMYRKTSVFADR